MITFGSDPEFILKDRRGELVSAIGLVKGTKEKKIDLGNGHYCFYDNVLVEMNIAPSMNENQMIANFSDCLRRVAQKIGSACMIPQASATYPEKECKHPDAKVFGCEPEYCAYELKQITAPTCENTFRSAGGHIHLGSTTEVYPLMAPIKGEDRMERDWGRVWTVRMLDLFVGLPSIVLDHDATSAARRKLYGKAGTHRPKEEYGVEYRATGNFWLASQRMARLVYQLCMHAVEFVGNQGHKKLWKIDDDPERAEHKCKAYDVQELRDTIDGSNVKKAKKMLEDIVKPHMPEALWANVFQASEVVVQPNFYREWGIA